jgi:hypothetical protein
LTEALRDFPHSLHDNVRIVPQHATAASLQTGSLQFIICHHAVLLFTVCTDSEAGKQDNEKREKAVDGKLDMYVISHMCVFRKCYFVVNP